MCQGKQDGEGLAFLDRGSGWRTMAATSASLVGNYNGSIVKQCVDPRAITVTRIRGAAASVDKLFLGLGWRYDRSESEKFSSSSTSSSSSSSSSCCGVCTCVF